MKTNQQTLEDFQVYVDKDLWQQDDDKSKEILRNNIDGLLIYSHILYMNKNEIAVSIDDLIKRGIIKSITIHKDI